MNKEKMAKAMSTRSDGRWANGEGFGAHAAYQCSQAVWLRLCDLLEKDRQRETDRERGGVGER